MLSLNLLCKTTAVKGILKKRVAGDSKMSRVKVGLTQWDSAGGGSLSAVKWLNHSSQYFLI